MKMALFSLILIIGCASQDPAQEPRRALLREANKDFWVGRTSDELFVHPYFAVLPLEKRAAGSKAVWSFRSEDKKGGSEVACNHVFQIESGVIKNYGRVGVCIEKEQYEFRPLDKNNRPLMSKAEAEDYVAWEKEVAEREKREAGKAERRKASGCNDFDIAMGLRKECLEFKERK